MERLPGISLESTANMEPEGVTMAGKKWLKTKRLATVNSRVKEEMVKELHQMGFKQKTIQRIFNLNLKTIRQCLTQMQD